MVRPCAYPLGRGRQPGLVLALALLACSVGGSACSGRHGDRHARPLLILGVDGMDPELLRQFIAAGKLPNLAGLAAGGTLVTLGTSDPPQSPVAWSNFTTGMTPAGHGIYDFVHRDPHALAPYLSTSQAHDPSLALSLFGWRLPLGSAKVELLREGPAFWDILADAGIPATVLKVPANFPPAGGHDGALVLAGMGAPDLLGTYGTYQVFTDDPALQARKLPAAVVHSVAFSGGRSARAELIGPPNPYLASHAPLAAPLAITVNPERSAALVDLDGQTRLLKPGEWSTFVPVALDPGLLAGAVHGIVRFALVSLTPHVTLYASPVNIDPTAPAMPISSPPDLARELAQAIGPFYTQGIAEETKAYEAGVLDTALFMDQVAAIFDEERKMMHWGLSHFDGGLQFHYFSVIDQVGHMFRGAMEPDAPPEERRNAGVLPQVYGWIDQVVGEALARVEPDTDVLVMSDHGIAPFGTKVNLNTWVLRRGFLVLREHPQPGALGHIDWQRTQAYALGLNQLFVNLRGREREGSVAPIDKPRVVARLVRGLESWIDPETGRHVVARAHVLDKTAFPDRAPDVIVGFARDYRSSDESALGHPKPEALFPNHDRWNGDHCMDASVVPGVLLSRRPIVADAPSLLDFAPTVLAHFGLTPPPQMVGHAFTNASPAADGVASAGAADRSEPKENKP